MNLVIISVLMLLSFTTIYFVTYRSIFSSIQEDLYRIERFHLISQVGTNNRPAAKRLDFAAPTLPYNESRHTLSFVLQTDSENQIQEIHSEISFNSDLYRQAINLAQNNDNDNGKIFLQDRHWSYIIRSLPDGNMFVFVDSTPHYDILQKLIYIFIVVSLFVFLISIFISNYLTNTSIEPIKSAFSKQKQFISDASHELKTPLAVIQTNVDVLLSNHKNKAPLSYTEDIKWLTYIKSEVERMTQLTKDLLYLTQIDSKETAPNIMTIFDLSHEIEKTMLGFEVAAYERHLVLDYIITPLCHVSGVKEHLTQVIFILMDNALKYTPSNGSIYLNVDHIGHHITVTVSNTGPDIPAADLPYIFDRFYRVDRSRNRDADSHGLGLSIAKAIIENHNGRIVCHSTSNMTTFTIRLNRAKM